MIGIQRDHGVNAVVASQIGYRPHHGDRAHGVDGLGPGLLVVEQALEGQSDKTRLSERAVFSGHIKLGRDRSEFLAQDHVLGGAGPDDRDQFIARLGQPLGERIQHRRAHPAADADHPTAVGISVG